MAPVLARPREYDSLGMMSVGRVCQRSRIGRESRRDSRPRGGGSVAGDSGP